MPTIQIVNYSRIRELKPAAPALVMVALLLTAILSLAALFAQSDQSARIAGNARILQAHEEILGATSAQRGSVAVALLIADASEYREVTEQQMSDAVSDIDGAGNQIQSRLDHLMEIDGSVEDAIAPQAAHVIQASTQIADLLRETQFDLAGTIARDQLIPALDAFEDAVVERRGEVFALIVAEEGEAGRVARAASIAVALLIPLTGFVMVRRYLNRRQLRSELEMQLDHERQKTQVKDAMIADLSHELRTPLTGIYGMALAMQDEGFTDPEFQREMTGIVVSEAADLARMIDDLLAASKADAGSLNFLAERTDPGREVDEVLVPYQATGTKIHSDCDPAVILADRLRLRQVIRNLVSNAVKHGGEHIEILARPNEDSYLITVSDDGPGVPSELQSRVFERFVHHGSAAQSKGSVGLGLSIARLLTEGMGGSLRYERNGGKTSFLIDLPLADPNTSEAEDLGFSESDRSDPVATPS